MSNQTSIPKRVYKLGPLITAQNLPTFKKSFMNLRGNYGPAGEALAMNVAYDPTLEIPTESFVQEVRLDNGTIKKDTVKWNKYGREAMIERNKVKANENKEYKKFEGPLWADLHEVISHNVLDRIKTDNKPKYELAQKKLDSLTLMHLITHACQGLNRNHVKKLETEYDNCYQGEMRFETFVVKHEEKHDALVTAGKEISDNEFCVHLRDHTNLSLGQLAVPEAYNTDPSSDSFPDYATYRAKVYSLSQTLQVIKNQQPKDQHHEGPKKVHDKGAKRKAEPKAPSDDAFAVMSAKVIEKVTAHFKKAGAGANKKAKTGADSTTAHAALTEYASSCWNCEGDGHPYFKCDKEKAVCTICKMKGHCTKFHEAFAAHAARRKAAREEREKGAAPVKHSKSVKIVAEPCDKDDTPVAHSKSLRVAVEQSTVIERGTIGDYIGALQNTARTFSVRVVGENITSDMETEADPELVQPPAVLPENALTNDEFVNEMQEYLQKLDSDVVATAGTESKEQESEGDSVVLVPRPVAQPAHETASAKVTQEQDDYDLAMGSDHSADEEGLVDTGSESEYSRTGKRKNKRNRKKKKIVVEEEEEEEPEPPMQTRSRSNSLSTIDKGSSDKAGGRKAPKPRSPGQAAGAKYRPEPGESPPSDSSVTVKEFPFLSPALQVWPERAVPSSEEERAEAAKADAAHFDVDTSNRDAMYKYYAGIFRKYEFVEALLSLMNNQPNSGKLETNESKVSVSVHAAQKTCAHNYKKYVNKEWTKDKYMGVGRTPLAKDLNAQAEWFGALHEAAVARGANLRAISACVDEMFDSPRARAFWEELTGVMDPVLPWSILRQTSLKCGPKGPTARKDSCSSLDEPQEQPTDRTRRSTRLSSMIPREVQKHSHVNPVTRKHFTHHTLHDSPETEELISAPRDKAFEIWVRKEEAELDEIKRAEKERARKKSLTAAELRKEKKEAETLAQRKAAERIEAENAANLAAAELLLERDANQKPSSSSSSSAKIGNARGDFGSHPTTAASQKAKKSQEPKPAKTTAAAAAKPKATPKSGQKATVEQQQQQLQAERAHKPISKREVVNLADDDNSDTYTASPTDLADPRFYAYQRQDKQAGSRRAENSRERREREDPSERDRRRNAASPRRQHDDRARHEREDRYGPRIAYGEYHNWSNSQGQVRTRDRSDSRDRSRNDGRYGSSDRHPRRDSGDSQQSRDRRSPEEPRRDRNPPATRASDKRPSSPYAASKSAERTATRSDYVHEHRPKKARHDEPSHTTTAPPEPMPCMLDDSDRVVKWYKSFDLRKLERLGLKVRPFKIGNKELSAAYSQTEFLSTEKLLKLLHFVDADDTASANPQMVNLLLETEFDLKAARDIHDVKMTARELQAGAAYSLTDSHPESREGDVIIDSGATVTLAKNSKGLRHFRDENRRLRLMTAGGGYLHSDKVGKLKGMGTVVVTKGAADNLLSVLQVCRANSDVRFEFQGCNATIHHPSLDHPLRAHIGMDDQYTLRQEDFQTLQRVLGDEARTFTVTTDPTPQELEEEAEEELEEAMASASVNDNSQPTTPATRPAPARELTQQILHDTVPPVPLTKQQLARAKEHEM